MSELTSQQILDMNKVIAKACGWVESKDYDGCPIYKALAGSKDRVFEGDRLVDDLTFEPKDNWNDFFIACHCMGVDSIQIDHRHDSDWWVALWSEIRHADGADDIDIGHPDKQTAAFLALYEYAKWKLEASK